MIRTPTVFVLGAGASCSYGFPLGGDLIRIICQQAADKGWLQTVGVAEREAAEITSALTGSHVASIDAFLEHRPDYIRSGKRLIAGALIPHEEPPRLRITREDDWYPYLWQRMHEGAPLDKLHENKVAFVTFNYDRSLEAFLFEAIRELYGVGAEEAAAVLSRIPFVHVHGQMGMLPWQTAPDGAGVRPYQASLSSKSVEIAAAGIRVIHEGDLDGSQEFEQARKVIGDAQRAIFLGFGYHETNMKRLARFPGFSGHTYGSCYRLEEGEIKRFSRHFGLELKDPTANALMFLRRVPDLD